MPKFRLSNLEKYYAIKKKTKKLIDSCMKRRPNLSQHELIEALKEFSNSPEYRQLINKYSS